MDGNIDEVRSSHKGPAQPPSLTLGTRWIDDSTAVWSSRINDGGAMLTESRIDPVSDIIIPNELRRRNLAWNGDLNCWQDGASETGLTASSNRVADGWRAEIVTHGTWTFDRSTTVPTVAQAGRQIQYSMRALCTTADTTVAAGAIVAMTYFIEGYDYQELYQQPHHISFWARSSTTGTYHLSLRNSATPDRSFVFQFTIGTANTWELKEFVLREVPSGGAWDFVEGIGLRITISLAAGTTFQTTANAWQNGNFIATSAQTNLAATANNNFHVADLRIHGGTVRNPVIIRTFNETLSEAQRRFGKTFNYSVKPAQNAGLGGSVFLASDGGSVSAIWRYPRSMRANPSITLFNPSAANSNWDGLISVDIASTFLNAGTDSVWIVDVNSDATDTNDYAIHATADARYT